MGEKTVIWEDRIDHPRGVKSAATERIDHHWHAMAVIWGERITSVRKAVN